MRLGGDRRCRKQISVPSAKMARALFLDRDGVINHDYGYVHRQEDFDLVPGIFELCLKAIDAGYLLIVVTNQAGIAKGIFEEADFYSISDHMKMLFQAEGISFADIYYSPFHKDATISKFRAEHITRKPHPGLFFEAALDHNISLQDSVVIGDNLTDLQAGKAAGIRRLFLHETTGCLSYSDSSFVAKDSLSAFAAML